jgi:hypothetical protein
MPGTYEIYTDMTYNQILAIITDYSKSLTRDEEADTGDTTTDTDTDNSSGTDPSTQDGSESDTGSE